MGAATKRMRRVFMRRPRCRRGSSRPDTATPTELTIPPSSASRAKGGGGGQAADKRRATSDRNNPDPSQPPTETSERRGR
eukprot:13648741-Alexandrium_andersonii.AAC.1